MIRRLCIVLLVVASQRFNAAGAADHQPSIAQLVRQSGRVTVPPYLYASELDPRDPRRLLSAPELQVARPSTGRKQRIVIDPTRAYRWAIGARGELYVAPAGLLPDGSEVGHANMVPRGLARAAGEIAPVATGLRPRSGSVLALSANHDSGRYGFGSRRALDAAIELANRHVELVTDRGEPLQLVAEYLAPHRWRSPGQGIRRDSRLLLVPPTREDTYAARRRSVALGRRHRAWREAFVQLNGLGRRMR